MGFPTSTAKILSAHFCGVVTGCLDLYFVRFVLILTKKALLCIKLVDEVLAS